MTSRATVSATKYRPTEIQTSVQLRLLSPRNNPSLMSFYDLSKPERQKLVQKIEGDCVVALQSGGFKTIEHYAIDSDTYIRKTTYSILGRIYRDHQELRNSVFKVINFLIQHKDEKARQTAVYTLGEIGKTDPDKVFDLLDQALTDEHHSVRDAVTGALKQLGEKNPSETIAFARKHLHNPDPKIRREIVHGLELRGRTHPEDILPLLKELENDPDRKIRETIIHVIGQISYKQGCLEKVTESLKAWENQDLIAKAFTEILEVHKRYERFSAKTREEARQYIEDNLSNFKKDI